MSFTKSFEIYNGFCHIDIDRLVITTSANPNEDIEPVSAKQNQLKLIFTSILISILIAGVIVGFLKQEFLWMGYCLVIAVLATIYFYRFITNSKTNIIYKSSIQRVQFLPSIYPIQHAHFIIRFLGESQIQQKRIIYLTANFAADIDPIIQTALQIMEEEFG